MNRWHADQPLRRDTFGVGRIPFPFRPKPKKTILLAASHAQDRHEDIPNYSYFVGFIAGRRQILPNLFEPVENMEGSLSITTEE
jgi:hypothetical protein